MTDSEELKKLSVKYGTALFILAASLLVGSVFFSAVLSLILSVDAVSENGDAVYFFRMLFNELSSYTIPLTAIWVLFSDELKESTFPGRYSRIKGESVLIFSGGLTVSAAASVISQYIIGFFTALSGSSAPQKAFSSTMPQNEFRFVVFLICVTVIAPVCEEIIFRKLLLVPLRKYGDMTAAVVSSVIFSLFHLNLTQLVYTMMFGFFLALAAMRSDSLKAPTAIHMVNNLLTVFMYYAPDSMKEGKLAYITSVLNVAVPVLQIAGIAALAVLAVKKAFVLKNSSSLTVGEQLGVMLRTPAAVAGIVMLAALYFVKAG